ncbi:unnamed protein product [Lactuca virosa]|uniref:Circadian clock associated 1 n=1 Tax=Lactuca virosa TaxID=75947 RepID=A0AAU9LC90_9ASTR|nr:unnamed protein product [Lactuca virosa]
MDTYSSSGEKLNIKTRKPYTITKQRERWTEEEHNSFLEALKLYGRAWQRIEEHIGTKTAVQIRSHAQKFFTKLEKEAVAKGVPTRQALDMEIPPPRPKRKPNYPYPRKTGSGTCPKTHHPNPNPKEEEDNATHHHHHHHQPTLVSSLPSGIDHLHLPEKQEETANTSEQVDVEKEEPPCASLSSENDNSIPRGVFRDFINLDETNESYITTIETRKYQKKSDQDGMHTSTHTSLFDFPEGQNHDDNTITNTNTNGVHSYPRHVPVQVVDGNQGNIPTGTEEMSTLEEKLEQVHNNPNPNLSVNNNIASRCCSSYQTIPTFHPPVFTHPFSDNHNNNNNNNEEENYRSLLHVSSTISSLIVSSLLQNPAAHAAASFASKFWHPPGNTNTEASSGDDSETPSPSMTSIAAATVAAATAWWAAHGLLPVCPPFYPTPTPTPFSFGAPPPPPPVTVEDGNQAREKAPPEKITDSSSEEEVEDSEGKLNTGSNPDDTTKGTGTGTVVEETNVNVRKQVDRSSCGSNTTSSSEIETDALEKKNIKEKEETAAAAASDVVPDLDSISRTSIIRGGRSTINPNESWKEVSEEGRLAFQALFSRQVLPQSFSDRHNNNINNNNNNNNSSGGGELDLNRMMLRGEKNMEEGLLTIGLGNVKLNVNHTHTHTGFKPYKRCSMEAKEKPGSSSNQNDDKAAKRMRFQAEGST